MAYKNLIFFLTVFWSGFVFSEEVKATQEVWGVRGLQILVQHQATQSSLTFELDCAHGSIPDLKLAAEGVFFGEGPYQIESGGPEGGNVIPATTGFYLGRIIGDRMVFTVDLPELKRPVVSFELKRNEAADLVKCL